MFQSDGDHGSGGARQQHQRRVWSSLNTKRAAAGVAFPGSSRSCTRMGVPDAAERALSRTDDGSDDSEAAVDPPPWKTCRVSA
jgi:hypothetical protein